ncbi:MULTISPECIES: dihydrolipoamide acetyltransferase family protein [unclassified Microcella]|uniref:dihydrolipoamide acetyltransferase family protein n=1 Tax=unclassified Microcella TaxID=2630066 RepID=UPI0006F9350A|nr:MULTISPECIES: dihydrolipoamide acetyltransferase family protein [unclassified Microcella]KQV25276.1 branched-chain alpha-keto acid dehydrogenase subunit E2 [Yonghaparkia sp. Root332]KRF31565.1 branched-chain alpha-keto acid dehydrogenase subunit E2 [Yonghaparkia sp. Soil809]
MTVHEFRLPDLGEGLTESELVEWHVAVGDRVTLNQVLADVETAKAIVQLPSPFAGIVAALHAEPGTTVQVGAPIVSIEVAADAPLASSAAGGSPVAEATPAPAAPSAPAPAAEVVEPDAPAEPAAERQSVLVGYGPAVETGRRPKRKSRSLPERPADRPSSGGPGGGAARGPGATRGAALATPPVRKLAHDLGVDLSEVDGTGDNGQVTRADVTRFAESGRAAASAPPAATGATGAAGARSSYLAADRPAEVRHPIKGVRKATAEAMVRSAFTAPHVTEFLTVDVTAASELVARLKARGQSASMLALVSRALCIAVGRNPSLNSRWDEAANEIVELRDIHLGIAVATPRGLLVPSIPTAQSMTVPQLADAIRELAGTARDGRTPPSSLSGGTITITNIGVFGVDAGTPIIVPGEAAILAMGAVRRMPWEFEGCIALRDVMTLSVSFDHRMVDGEQGSRFLTDIGGILHDPASVLALV